MNANPILLQKKYSRVIEQFARLQDISLDAALDFFYNSEVYPLMRDGVSDMHCMSDAYLAEELKMEYEQKNMEEISGLCHCGNDGSDRNDSVWKQQFL